MTPPYKITLWTADGNARLINFAWSFEAAERVVERVGGLGTNQVIRVRDARAALVLSTAPTE
jgi:hypothetical protein